MIPAETQAFAAGLGLTVVTLVLVVVTGVKARVRLHLALVATAVLLLGATIYFAEQLGDLYDLRAAGAIYPIHLRLAEATTLAYLLPIASGIATYRNRAWRRLHFKLALLVLVLTALTAITGTAMLTVAPRASAGSAEDARSLPGADG